MRTPGTTEFAPEGAAIYDAPELRESVQMVMTLLAIMRTAHADIMGGNSGKAGLLLGEALRRWDAVAPPRTGDAT